MRKGGKKYGFPKIFCEGDPRGRSLLGFMFEKGYGTKADASRALEYYELASRENDTFGHIRLGFVYLEGRLGVAADLKSAEHHLTVASKSASAQAWLGLGLLARKSDPKKASKLFAVAAQKGSLLGAFELSQLQLAEDGMLCGAALQNLAHVFEWSSGVRRMLEKAFKAERVERNTTRALELYEILAWAGVEEAQANAAHIYHHVKNDMEKALRYYELSAEQGNARSHLMIGNYYYTRNLNLSHTAYRRAADLHQ